MEWYFLIPIALAAALVAALAVVGIFTCVWAVRILVVFFKL